MPWLALAALSALALVALNLNRIADIAMTPRTPFDPQRAPPPPDYSSPTSWSALPERKDLADRAPPGDSALDQLQALIDVFYIHPTTYIGNQWNAPTDDPSLNEATDRVATGIQASAFSGCCAIYAPRYRQANGTAFYRRSDDGQRAIGVAYDDVRRAFDAFNARRGASRPFIFAAHSQGSILAERLLYEAISGAPLRDALVAAYLIGGEVTLEGLRERAPDIAPCRAPDDVHCVVAWRARGPAFVPTRFEFDRTDPRELLCTNPLTWKSDGAYASRDRNLGAVFLESDDHTPRTGFADAQCKDGTLVVSQVERAPRDLPSRILDWVMGSENYHPIEYQLFFMNLRRNAVDRSHALLTTSR